MVCFSEDHQFESKDHSETGTNFIIEIFPFLDQRKQDLSALPTQYENIPSLHEEILP